MNLSGSRSSGDVNALSEVVFSLMCSEALQIDRRAAVLIYHRGSLSVSIGRELVRAISPATFLPATPAASDGGGDFSGRTGR